MKILIPTGIFPPDIGGPASSVPILADAWASKGHQVVVVTYSNVRRNKEDATRGYRVHRVPRKLKLPFRYLLYTWKLFLASWKADVIFAQDGVAAGFPGWLIAKLLRKKFVVKIVGDFAWEHAVVQDGYEGSIDEFQKEKDMALGGRIMAWVQKFVVRHTETVIVPSKCLSNIVNLWGAKRNHIRVVYNGIKKQKSDETAKRSRHCILAAGRLAYYKRFDVLIDALPKILEKHKDAVLVLIGDGPERERLEERAERLGIRKRVQFTGAISRSDVLQAMRECGVYAHPSSYEGFSHQLLEAFATRIPVVASNIGGITELVQDRENGLLAEVGDVAGMTKAILRMMQDGDLSEKCVRNATRDVRNFTIEKQIENTADILFEKKSLRPLLIGRDSSLIDEDSFGAKRMQAYAERVEAMRIVIAGRHDPTRSLCVRNYRVEIVDIRPKFFSLARLFFRTLFSAWRHRANIIVSQDPFELGLVACKVAFLLRIPFAVEDHGAFYSGKAWRRESMLNRFRWLVGRIVILYASGIRAVSERARKSYKDMNLKKPVAVIPVAIDRPAPFLPGDRKGFVALYAGRFSVEKNLAMMLSAFSDLRKDVSSATLVLIGEGPEKEDIINEIKYLKLGSSVEVHPWVENISAVFKEVDIAVLTSVHEGYSRFAAEAVAHGVPVVMTDVGLAGELVRDGKEGIVVPVDDVQGFAEGMKRLAANAELRKHMHESALKRARQIPKLEEIADRMAKFWKEVQRI